MIGGITSSQVPVQADLRTSSHEDSVQEIISVPSCEAEIVRPGTVSCSNEMSNETTDEEKSTLSMAIREMKQMPNVVSLFSSMNLIPQARLLLEQAVRDW